MTARIAAVPTGQARERKGARVNGFEATTVAGNVNIPSSSRYSHFATKEEMSDCVVRGDAPIPAAIASA